jgi:hypothetical protein
MFDWFKKEPTIAPDSKQKEEFKRHFLKADGSPLVRSLIASAMCAVEEEMVTQERNNLPGDQGLDFMLTLECFVAYALKIGVERVVEIGSFETARPAIENHFQKYAFFDQKSYQTIWRDLDANMKEPLNMGAEIPDTPIAKLLLTGLQNNKLIPNGEEPLMGFKSHLIFELQAIADFAERTTRYIIQTGDQGGS